MKIRFLRLIFCGLVLILLNTFSAPAKVIVTEKDKKILHDKLEKFSKDKDLSMGTLMLKIGLDFKDTPYVAKTLDKEMEESLVVNLRELDCTTFIESVLAIALTVKSGEPAFETFIAQLERIRYRGGHLNEYPSRLHYFSEWITDNASKGIVTDVTHQLGGTIHPLSLNFMGTHPNLYQQLNGNAPFTDQIRKIEREISARPYYFISKELVPGHEAGLLDGDIVAMTTRIAGLDVSHLGMIFRKEGKTYLLNASSLGMRVEVTPKTLAEYLNGSKSVTGIFVVRGN